MADRDHPQGDGRLAARRQAGPRLRQRDGPEPPTEREQGDRQLAGARGRQAAVQTAVASPRARQVHRRFYLAERVASAARVRERRGVAAGLDPSFVRTVAPRPATGRRPGCSATCSGPRSGHRRAGSPPRRRTPAKVGSARAPPGWPSRSRCRRSDRPRTQRVPTGIEPLTVVPRPAADAISSEPPSASSRSRMFVRPDPCAAATSNPTPSSRDLEPQLPVGGRQTDLDRGRPPRTSPMFCNASSMQK